MRSPLLDPLQALADSWRAATTVSRRQLALAAAGLVWVLALLLARHGTLPARALAYVAMALSSATAIAWRVVERRRLRDPAQIVRGLVRRLDRDGADRALRALSLVGPEGQVHAMGTSEALAQLHVARALARIPADRIVERAASTAARVGLLALAGAACSAGIVLTRPWSVLEGADVLVARRGLAPVSVRWLEDVEVVARPPDYLHEPERRGPELMSLSLPYGTQVTVRGVPRHPGPTLYLSGRADDANLLAGGDLVDVPFVDDGSGAVVARWSVARNVSLRVVARFGDVVIPGPESLAIECVRDMPPTVLLEGAPRRITLVDQGDEDIPIRYEASDDHGLREVHLVLRSGTREERRALAHLDGATRSDKGGQVLKPHDPFLKKSHAPVEVTVEAKDNDPLTGPKWGASPALVLVPPVVGEPEARRLEALRSLRDALVDLLAWRLSNAPPVRGPGRDAFVVQEARRSADAAALLERTLGRVYGGVRVPLRIRATLAAAEQHTRKALRSEASRPTAETHADVAKATERFVLITDAVVHGLGLRDAREAARQLADVADELSSTAAQARDGAGADRVTAEVRMDAAVAVLGSGASQMRALGSVGRDLGEIVEADLLRVRRARDASDFIHAEWAARDLAARLHQPDPSFGARGTPRHARGESGGDPGAADEEAPPDDDVDRAFQEAARDLEQLAQDHAGELAKMDKAVASATSEEEIDELRREAKHHADAIREAVRGLPSVGNGSDSWTSKGAAARELAEQMARSLEQGEPKEAVQSGHGALDALDEAKKILQKRRWVDDLRGEGPQRVDDARRGLEAETKWAEAALDEMRRRAADRARKELQEGGQEEGKLAARAHDLAQQARDRGSLPEQAVSSIEDAERAARQAAEALRQGEAENGLNRQREAQQALEAADDQIRGDEDEPSKGEEGDGRAGASKGHVPSADEHKGPEEFRGRVLRGLGQPASGALRDAVRRYAEGLLR